MKRLWPDFLTGKDGYSAPVQTARVACGISNYGIKGLNPEPAESIKIISVFFFLGTECDEY